jgi:hypothetical protein
VVYIPEWKAFPQGHKDGREGKPNLANHCARGAREEYERGYAEGKQFAKRQREEKPMASAGHTLHRKGYPRGPNFTVYVTDTMMEHARVRDSSHCMIAMGVRDAKPEMVSIAVDLQTIRFSDREKGYRYTYLTPRIAQKALIQFDQGEMPKAFSFRLYGAQVTKMAHKVSGQTPRSMTEAQAAGVKKMRETLSGEKGAHAVAVVSPHATMPVKIGGQPPPLSNFARRRVFGLKALRI